MARSSCAGCGHSAPRRGVKHMQTGGTFTTAVPILIFAVLLIEMYRRSDTASTAERLHEGV